VSKIRRAIQAINWDGILWRPYMWQRIRMTSAVLLN
jgi:hypothetical protein